MWQIPRSAQCGVIALLAIQGKLAKGYEIKGRVKAKPGSDTRLCVLHRLLVTVERAWN